jgi:hypothetical protein
VRVITKGPPYRNFVLKTLQKTLWKRIRRCPAAALVGEYVSEEYLSQQIGQLREAEEYTSVDYTDATNEIHGWVSEVIIDEVAKVFGLTAEQHLVARKNLTGHLLEDPSSPTGRRTYGAQVRGQLMGSILSFPVLCLANLAICRSAQERDRGRRLSLMKSGSAGPAFCINGDDAVLRGRTSHQHWLSISSAAGLSPSPGKVYRSKTFLNMNSTHFRVKAPTVQPEVSEAVSIATIVAPTGTVQVEINVEPGKPAQQVFLERVKYVNLGLLKGYKRSEIKASVTDVGLPDSLGAIARWLVLSSPPEVREWILKKFLNRHWDELKRTSLPWFLPEHLGGLGIPRPAGKLGQKNLANDMRLAAAVYRKRLPRRPQHKEWQMLDKAERELKAAGVHPHVAIGKPKENLRLTFNYVVETLLRARGIRSLYSKDERTAKEREREYSGYLRKCEKFILLCKRDMPKVQPFTPETLPHDPSTVELFRVANDIVEGPEPGDWLTLEDPNLVRDDTIW